MGQNIDLEEDYGYAFCDPSTNKGVPHVWASVLDRNGDLRPEPGEVPNRRRLDTLSSELTNNWWSKLTGDDPTTIKPSELVKGISFTNNTYTTTVTTRSTLLNTTILAVVANTSITTNQTTVVTPAPAAVAAPSNSTPVATTTDEVSTATAAADAASSTTKAPLPTSTPVEGSDDEASIEAVYDYAEENYNYGTTDGADTSDYGQTQYRSS